MKIHVCPHSKLGEVVAASGARHLIALVSDAASFERPGIIRTEDFLLGVMNDITTPRPRLVLPSLAHVEALLAFRASVPEDAPMVLTCYAGISRSTATAFMFACAARTDLDEQDIALQLRALAPFATPNIRLVTLADQLLGRSGRMTRAIEKIGRGEEAFEGRPFVFKWPPEGKG